MNNYSKQREIILNVLKQNPIHPTAEQVYQLVIKTHPNISKSTVYRNINLLAENGVIKKIAMASGPEKFDYMHKPHQHFVCTKCSCIHDIEYNFDIEEITKNIQQQIGSEITINEISLSGICEKCKSEQLKEKKA